MADTNLRVRDANTGTLEPLGLHDNGDGTYAVKVLTSGSGSTVLYLRDASSGQLIPIRMYDNGDGTLSMAVSGS